MSEKETSKSWRGPDQSKLLVAKWLPVLILTSVAFFFLQGPAFTNTWLINIFFNINLIAKSKDENTSPFFEELRTWRITNASSWEKYEECGYRIWKPSEPRVFRPNILLYFFIWLLIKPKNGRINSPVPGLNCKNGSSTCLQSQYLEGWSKVISSRPQRERTNLERWGEKEREREFLKNQN